MLRQLALPPAVRGERERKGDGWGVRAEAEKDAAGVGGVDKAVGTGWAKSKVKHTAKEPDHRKRKQRPKVQATLSKFSAKRQAISREDPKHRGSQTKTPRKTTTKKRKTTATPRKSRYTQSQEATHRKAKRPCQRQVTMAQFLQKPT